MDEQCVEMRVPDPAGGSIKAKKPRKRMKDIRKKVAAQMEFYFSDSNLQKDRFLKTEIDKSEDGFVDMKIFLNFNKIRQLTDDVKVIARSLKKSSLLKLSDDESKIRRAIPLQTLPDVDDRTVYVECLPRTVDHVWVQNLFSQCGNVLYVSLPRYKTTGDLKGFGFVEFASKEEAAKACEMLNNPPPLSGKAGRFPKWNKLLSQLKKKTGEGPEPMEDQTVAEKLKEVVEEPVQKPCKKHKRRRRHTSESSVDGSGDPIPGKRRKTESSDEPDTRKGESSKDSGKLECCKEQGKKDLDETVSDGLKSEEDDRREGKKKKKKKKRLSDAVKSVDEDSELTDTSFSEKEKRVERGKRKRTADSRESGEFSAPQTKVPKTSGSKPVATSDNTETNRKKRKRKKKNKEKDVPPPQLKVIAKREWLSLRTDYLTQQKSNMAALKQTLQQQMVEQEREAKKAEKMDGKTTRPAIEFVAGVIVKVQCSSPMNRQTLKEKLPDNIDVAYFDIKADELSGHIRCKDARSAKKISDLMLESYTFDLMTGDSETQYWDKLRADRNDKFNNKHKSKKRGSQKLVDKAQRHNAQVMEKKHIVFED